MLDRLGRLAHTIERDTPEDRDRYLDLLRVAAILVVVLGHWLARVIVERDGGYATGHLLEVVPATQWATWVAQVMPLFFIVGGLLNLRSWRRAREGGTGAVAWVRRRARRLLRPLVPLLVLWVALAALLDRIAPDGALPFGPGAALTPVWFLAAYLVVTALTPVLADRGDVAIVALLAAGAAVVDALRFAEPDALAWVPAVDGEPAFAVVNYLLIWVAVHQLGFWWHDGRLPRATAAQLSLAAAALAAVAALVALAGYPLSMVAGADASNDAPPTLALLGLGLVQLSVAMALRPAAEAWLARPRVWATVTLLGSRLMTVFLWHQTAMLAAAAVVVHSGLWPAAAGIGPQWWAQRPLWVVVCALLLAPLIAVFGSLEQASAPPGTVLPPRLAAAVTAAAVLATSASLGWLIVGGLTDPDGPLGLPVVPLAGIVAGLAGLGAVGRGRAQALVRRARSSQREPTASSDAD